MNLLNFLQTTKKKKKIKLFYDLETYQYNEREGYKKPSLFKNAVYIMGVSWNFEGETYTERFPGFIEFFTCIDEAYGRYKSRPTVDFIAHNGNKYDNHYLRKSLIEDYGMEIKNLWIKNVENLAINNYSTKLKDLSPADKQGCILEKRVKSSINLDMTFFMKNQQFNTIDNFIKTNAGIEVLGKKLLDLGVITKDQTKQSYEYELYNKADDMTTEEVKEYSKRVYESLTPEQLTYVDNDVIILAKSEMHYAELFNGFDYSKFTFTSNILDSYNNNNLTSFQLLNRVVNPNNKKDKIAIRYTDYHIGGNNLYDWLKPFYRGGLNFYNETMLGHTIEDVFSMDINSSYPYAMHNFKIPTFVKSYNEFKVPTEVEIEISDDTYTLYQITKEEFEYGIIEKIQSRVLRQILVKYYNTTDTVNINSYTFRMIKNVTGIDITSIKAINTVTFETEYFGSRDVIESFYKIKTVGRKPNKVIFNSPYDITETDEVNEHMMSNEEVQHSKVNLNGLYGIPALRAYFNMFTYENGKYVNHTNGFKNAERNIVFSIFVTSVSLWNLLSPLKHLSQREIDKNFIYCDTDSLYMKKTIEHKIPTDILDPNVLGKWEIEHTHISKFHVLNHKKYAFVDEDGKIDVKSGGIPLNSFNRNMPFEEFISTQFSHGVQIKTLRSIYTQEGTMALYKANTTLEQGTGYMHRVLNPAIERQKQLVLADIRKTLTQEDHADDLLYIETPFGTLSKQDIFPYYNKVNKFADMYELVMKQREVKTLL